MICCGPAWYAAGNAHDKLRVRMICCGSAWYAAGNAHDKLRNVYDMLRTPTRKISCGNSFKEMTGRDKLHFHLACSQDWVRDEGQASAPPPSTPPTKLGRPVWGPYNALRPYRPRGKEAAAAASFPLGEESRPKPSWPDGWGLLRLLKQPWVYIHTNWHFIMGEDNWDCDTDQLHTSISVSVWHGFVSVYTQIDTPPEGGGDTGIGTLTLIKQDLVILVNTHGPIVYYHYTTDYAWYSVHI